MKITSRGRVTIPKELRESLGMLPGTNVEFIEENGEVRVRKAKGGRRRGEEVVRHLREAAKNYTMTTEELRRLTGGADWGTDRLDDPN
jgi:antitoxin PrlF